MLIYRPKEVAAAVVHGTFSTDQIVFIHPSDNPYVIKLAFFQKVVEKDEVSRRCVKRRVRYMIKGFF